MTIILALRIFGPCDITKLAAATGLSWTAAGHEARALYARDLVVCNESGWSCSPAGCRLVDHHEVVGVSVRRDEELACVGRCG